MNRSVTWASRTFSGKWIPGTSNSISVFRTEVCFVLLNSDRMYEIRGFTRYPFPSVVFCIFFCGWKLLCRTGFYTFGWDFQNVGIFSDPTEFACALIRGCFRYSFVQSARQSGKLVWDILSPAASFPWNKVQWCHKGEGDPRMHHFLMTGGTFVSSCLISETQWTGDFWFLIFVWCSCMWKNGSIFGPLEYVFWGDILKSN